MMNAPSLTYLATPYSHPDPAVQQARFETVNRVAAVLMQQGEHVFSPISHTHPIAEAGGLPRGWDYWEAYDRAILRCCSKVIVLMQEGWNESKGVAAEIAIAQEMGILIQYMGCGSHEVKGSGKRDSVPVHVPQCSLCGEEQHTLAECPSSLNAEDSRRLLITTRRALWNLLKTCPHEFEGEPRMIASLEARRVLDVLRWRNDVRMSD